jgi:hypothetical protein
LERSQRIFATELPTVPKPSRATLQLGALSVALLPIESRVEERAIFPLSQKRDDDIGFVIQSSPG